MGLSLQGWQGVSKRGAAPLSKEIPPLLRNALAGEGDTGGEVDKTVKAWGKDKTVIV